MSKHVVIVGGGFGGISAAKALGNKEGIEVTLVDKTNHHLFQPLLYQVAIAGLAPSDIASPLRAVLRNYQNIKIIMNEVIDLDAEAQLLILKDSPALAYDEIIFAHGVQNNYFNHPEWANLTYGIKDLGDAVSLRNHLLTCFESAEQESDIKVKNQLLRFIIIGAGPTGVELAGSIAELSRFTLNTEFKNIQSANSQVIIIEKGTRLLATFDPSLSDKARSQIEELGVHLILGQGVKNITQEGVELEDGTFLASKTIIWSAGVGAGSLSSKIPSEKDRMGRVIVNGNCSLDKYPNLYVIGDAANFNFKGKPLPGVSPVAIQQGKYVANTILKKIEGKDNINDFSYFDKGSMSTIGRKRAIADLNFIKLSGTLAWLSWLIVHLAYLVGFRNKFIVFFNWIWSYFTYKRGSRLINKSKDKS